MQCLYCGNRISLLRKLKDSEFCSVKHRNLYHKEQTDLALARLTEAGNRITQPRRPAELVEAVEDKPVAATSGEGLNLPEPSGFISEPSAESSPKGPDQPSIDAEWLSVTAMPPLLEAPEAKFTWGPLGYCRPALEAARTGGESPRLGGGVPQAEFKPVKLQLPVPALELDLGEEAGREAPEHYGVAPPVPIPMPSPARPEEAPPRSPVPVAFEAGPLALALDLGEEAGREAPELCEVAPPVPIPMPSPARPEEAPPRSPVPVAFEAGPPVLVSNLELSPVKPSSAGWRVLPPGAAPPHAAGKAPRKWPAVPSVSVRTLMDGAFQHSGATQILAEQGARNHVPSLAAYLPQPLAACSSDARAPEAAGAVAGTPLRLLPASAGLPDAELRLALCRRPKPGAAAGTTSVLATGVDFAGSQPDPVRLPGFLAPAIAVGMRTLGGRVSMPLAAAEPLQISTEAAEEIPMAVTRRLPELAWSAATPQLRAEAALSALDLATHTLPPRPMAGADQVVPLASRAKGGRKVAARTALPTAHLPLPGPCLSQSASLVPVAPPRTAGAEAALVAPLPEIHTFIPSRRRPELKARIAMPNVGGLVPCRGMATSVNLQPLGAHLARVEDPRLASGGATRFMDWAPFAPPAMPSPQAILGPGVLTVTPASVRPLMRMFPIDLTNLTTVVPPVKPAGATAPHTICHPPRLPSFGTAQDGSQAHQRTSALLNGMIERLDGGPSGWALARLWRRAPVSLKGMVAGVVLLGALTAMGIQSSGIQWNVLREEIRVRAAVNLVDDFRAGMGAWGGAENWAETWSYDNAGFVQTGNLALYRPSMTLNDYQFEFLGQIASRGMGWVFRAVDTRNYYAMKIVFTNSGPLPAGVIVRYAVIDGKPGPKTQLPLPMGARPDTMYRIRVDADGSNFTAQFQGQIVDVWSDSRLATGGVGFFSDKGEQAKIRWIEVTHQSDFLGKLCAYLVPYDTRSANRSLTR